MGNLGVILSAMDGLVIATDTSPGSSAANNESIRQLGHNFACFVYSPEADQVLQAYMVNTQPLPPTHRDFVRTLSEYMRTTQVTARVAFAVAGIEPSGDNSIQEIVWTGQELTGRSFPGNLIIGVHSIARYISNRIHRGNPSLESSQEQAVFMITETRLALPDIRAHIAMASIDRRNGFQWKAEEKILLMIERARQRSQRLEVGCIGLF